MTEQIICSILDPLSITCGLEQGVVSLETLVNNLETQFLGYIKSGLEEENKLLTGFLSNIGNFEIKTWDQFIKFLGSSFAELDSEAKKVIPAITNEVEKELNRFRTPIIIFLSIIIVVLLFLFFVLIRLYFPGLFKKGKR